MLEAMGVERRMNRGGRRVDLDLGMTMIPLTMVTFSGITTQVLTG